MLLVEALTGGFGLPDQVMEAVDKQLAKTPWLDWDTWGADPDAQASAANLMAGARAGSPPSLD